MSAASDDYYALLGVSATADETELRRAWHRVALQWHPDRAGVDATGTFQSISAAYAVLSDPISRALYDRRRGVASRAEPTPTTEVRQKAPGVMLRRLTGPLDALIACRLARYAEAGTVEIFPNAQEATQGGMVTISMRVAVLCASCTPSTCASCRRCSGRGSTDELFSAWLAVPPNVTDGFVLTPSAQIRGVLQPVSFRVRLYAA